MERPILLWCRLALVSSRLDDALLHPASMDRIQQAPYLTAKDFDDILRACLGVNLTVQSRELALPIDRPKADLSE
jgi:hypothetical protein